MSAIWILLAVVNINAWLFPAPADKLGWGLRLRPADAHRCYLSNEVVENDTFAILLINRGKEGQKHVPLKKSRDVGDLEGAVVRLGGQPLPRRVEDRGGLPGLPTAHLVAGQFASTAFRFRDFGYSKLEEPGQYELRMSLKTTRGVVDAPVVKFTVIELGDDAVLSSYSVPIEGYKAKRPDSQRDRAAVQQIKIRDRYWLFYLKYLIPESGGKASYAIRVAEIPGKVVDLKVEGAFGAGNPLTITYRETTYTKLTTTHVINSIDGKPWTAEEEKLRQEKLKREAKLPADKK